MSQKSRIQVSLSDETRASLQALADARNGSLAAVCGELLQEVAPVALQMANALQKAKSAPARALREMVDVLEEQIAQADQLSLDMTPKATGRKRKTG